MALYIMHSSAANTIGMWVLRAINRFSGEQRCWEQIGQSWWGAAFAVLLLRSCWNFRTLFSYVVNLVKNSTFGWGWNFPCLRCPEVIFLFFFFLSSNKCREHYPCADYNKEQMLSNTPIARVSKHYVQVKNHTTSARTRFDSSFYCLA